MSEAQRALTFAFWWIVRWEAFSATTPEALKIAHKRQERLVRKTQVAASVESVLDVEHKNGVFTANIKLADVPPDAEFTEWLYTSAQKIRSKIPTKSHKTYIRIDEAGIVTVTHDMAELTGAQIVEAINDGLREAEAHLHDAKQLNQKAKSQAVAKADALFETITLPHWVDSVQVNPERFGSFAELRSVTLQLKPRYSPHARIICESLRHVAASSTSGGKRDFTYRNGGVILGLNEYSPDEIGTLLASATDRIDDHLRAIESREASDRKAAQTLREALDAAISSL